MTEFGGGVGGRMCRMNVGGFLISFSFYLSLCVFHKFGMYLRLEYVCHAANITSVHDLIYVFSLLVVV